MSAAEITGLLNSAGLWVLMIVAVVVTSIGQGRPGG